MHKSNRALMAESIQEVYCNASKIQQSAFNKVYKVLGEALLYDVFMINVYKIPSNDNIKLNTLVTSLRSSLGSEYAYHKMIRGLDERDIKYLNGLLQKENNFLNYRIAQITGTNPSIPMNLLRLLDRIDPKNVDGSYGIKKLISKKAKTAAKADVTKIMNTIRPMMASIIAVYGKLTDTYHIEKVSDKGKDSLILIRTATDTAPVNYMRTEPYEWVELNCAIDLDKDTSARRAINTIRCTPHTFDLDYNNAIEAILDTDLFEQLIRGKSSDEESVKVKLSQARITVREGIDFWNELGQGNVYFNYVVDFRGRISQLGGLSAVGHKVGKAMLRSGRKTALGPRGYDNILIALAGAMGYDKETFDFRLNWARDNAPTYAEIGKHLIENPAYAFTQLKKLDADDVFAAASICLELHRIRQYHGDVREFKSNLYIGYDATSSAVQLVGLIMGNYKLTEASNVRVGENTEDKIHDAYMLIADSMDNAIANGSFVSEDGAEFVKMWTEFPSKVKRAIAKPLLMTRLYGSTFLTHMRRAREAAVEKGLISADDTEKLQRFGKLIAQLFNYAFNNEDGYNCLRGYEDFIKEIANAYTVADKFAKWEVQDHEEELQSVTSVYTRYAGDRYFCFIEGKKHRLSTYGLDLINDPSGELNYTEKKELDKTRAKSAIAPNYIHSHDALVLHKTVNALSDFSMRLTHDCFAITPGEVNKMSETINRVYADLFGNNNMQQLVKVQEACYRATGTFVELPEEYNIDGIPSEQIIKAKYAFS